MGSQSKIIPVAIFCGLAGAAFLLAPTMSCALTVAQPMYDQAVVISKEPDVTVTGCGQRESMYVTVSLQIDNRSGTQTLSFELPKESLVLWFDETTGKLVDKSKTVATGARITTGPLFLHGAAGKPVFPARMRASLRYGDERKIRKNTDWTHKVEIPAGYSAIIDIGFPALEGMCEKVRLTVSALRLSPDVILNSTVPIACHCPKGLRAGME